MSKQRMTLAAVQWAVLALTPEELSAFTVWFVGGRPTPTPEPEQTPPAEDERARAERQAEYERRARKTAERLRAGMERAAKDAERRSKARHAAVTARLLGTQPAPDAGAGGRDAPRSGEEGAEAEGGG